MRNRTPQRARDERLARKLEASFLADVADLIGGWLVCAIRGRNCLGNQGVVVHHMVAGSNRWQAITLRQTFLQVCIVCNSSGGDAEDRTLWPLPRQLAAKRIYDPAWFDLDIINQLLNIKGHPRQPVRVTLEMVDGYKDTIPT